MIQNDADVEDVTQRVFVDLLSALPEYNGDPPISTWLARITRSTVRRSYRRKSNRRSLIKELRAVGATRTTVPPEARVSAREQLERLLTSLPQDLQRVIRLYHHEGLTQEEIAAQVGVATSTVSKHLARARKVVRTLAKGK